MSDFEQILGLFSGAAQAQRQFKSAYEAGRDAGLHGANPANSHFSWFSSREQANEWDRGRASISASEGASK